MIDKVDHISLKAYEKMILPDHANSKKGIKELLRAFIKDLEVTCYRCFHVVFHGGKFETNYSLANHCIRHLHDLKKEQKSSLEELKNLFNRTICNISNPKNRAILLRNFQTELARYESLAKEITLPIPEARNTTEKSKQDLPKREDELYIEGDESAELIRKKLEESPDILTAFISVPKFSSLVEIKKWIANIASIKAIKPTIKIQFKNDDQAWLFHSRFIDLSLYPLLEKESQNALILQGIKNLSSLVSPSLSDLFDKFDDTTLLEKVDYVLEASNEGEKTHDLNKLLLLIARSKEGDPHRKFEMILKHTKTPISELLNDLGKNPVQVTSYSDYMPSRPYLLMLDFEAKKKNSLLRELLQEILGSQRDEKSAMAAGSENIDFVSQFSLNCTLEEIEAFFELMPTYHFLDKNTLWQHLLYRVLSRNDYPLKTQALKIFWNWFSSEKNYKNLGFAQFVNGINFEGFDLALSSIPSELEAKKLNFVVKAFVDSHRLNDDSIDEKYKAIFESYKKDHFIRKAYDQIMESQ